MEHAKKHLNPSPFLRANPISKLLYWWMKDLFLLGFRDDLTQDDLYNALPSDLSDKLGDEMERLWKEENRRKRGQPGSLLRTIIKMFGCEYMKYGILNFLVNCVFRVSQPLLLASLIRYFSPGSTTTKTMACTYAGCLFVASFTPTFFFNTMQRLSLQLGMRIRVACCSLMYRKILRLSRRSAGMTTTGQIVNLMSNDVNRFDRVTPFLHSMWISPVQTIIVTYFIWQFVGVSALVGVGALFVQTVLIQGYFGNVASKLRKKKATRTDERLKLMNEIIAGIQVLKMYAWEKTLHNIISILRKREISLEKKAAYLSSMYISISIFCKGICLFLTFLSYVLMGNSITPEIVFPLVHFYNVLEPVIMFSLPQAFHLAAESRISIKRIEEFLALDEIQPKAVTNEEEKKNEKVGLKMDNVCAKWTCSSIVDTLHDLNANLEPGKLCAVVGSVGSGKSSLIQAILGELPLSSGTLTIGGEISYSSQEPWLFVGTVLQNILFGQPYETKRYKEVVQVCALQRDFELFPNGDKTVVGERGVSLSGGQRARITLARCVYREADVYLLDDPLSAVDAHVSKHLLEECINGFLASKTRILATHQLQHIKEADLIIILNNGQIEDQGSYSELLERKANFPSLADEQEAYDVNSVASVVTLPSMKVSAESMQDNKNEDESEDEEPQKNAEHMSKGRMKVSVLTKYFRAGGSALVLTGLVISAIACQTAASGVNYWVTFWTNQEQLRKIESGCVLQITMSATSADGSVSFVDALVNSSINKVAQFAPAVVTEDLSPPMETATGPGMDDDGAKLNESHRKYCNSAEGVMFSNEVTMYIYGALIVGTIIIAVIRAVFFFKVCMSASINLHNTMFSSILHGSMRFFNINPSGRILNRFSKDMGTIDEVMPLSILESIQILLLIVGIMMLVAYVNYLLIIPIACVMPLYYLISHVYLSTAQSVKRLEGTARSPVLSHVSATFNGLSTIRCFRAQDMLRIDFDAHQDLHSSAWYLTIVSIMACGMWMEFVSNIFMGIVNFSFLVSESEYFGANVGLAITQSLLMSGLLQYGIRQMIEALSHMTAVERVLEYCKIEKERGIESGQRPPKSWPFKGVIEFDHVNFSYSENDPPVLHDLCFKIKAAQKVGIVGRTGAGKSSLISALFRLAHVEGSITIDNLSTDIISLYDLRSRISIIPQEPVLFSSSLRNNLDPFHNYKDSTLWSVLEEVKLKEGVESLDLYVNAGGSNFSTGQRQLICLARAIVRDNRILVMDEATANVDPQTDAMIQKIIRRKFKNCTVLTIAHRINTIIDSDKVLVMDAGTMVEFDHPHILLQNPNGHFYRTVQETGKSMAQCLSKAAEESYKARHNNDD